MLKIFGRVSLLILFLSCGIPSFEYINEPTINSTSYNYFTFTISLGDNSYINGFKIYARYFIEESDDTSFDDIDISDTSNDTEEYLVDLGYSVVSIIDSSEIVDEVIDYTDPYGLFVEKFLISSDAKFTVNYDNSSSLPINMIIEDSSESYTFVSNYGNDDDLIHTIGNYTDDNGIKFLEELEEEQNADIDSSIWVEFAVFNLGLSSDLEPLESLPVYCTAINLQTNNN